MIIMIIIRVIVSTLNPQCQPTTGLITYTAKTGHRAGLAAIISSIGLQHEGTWAERSTRVRYWATANRLIFSGFFCIDS